MMVSVSTLQLMSDLNDYRNLTIISERIPVDVIHETVALLSKLDVDKHIDIQIELDEMDLTSAESKATYAQIK